MLDIKKVYDQYQKSIKSNKKVLAGIDSMLNCEGIIQFSVLQFIAHNNVNGTTLNALTMFGIDEELAQIVLTEAEKNGLIVKKFEKYYITDSGKSTLIASFFRAIETL